MAKFNGFGGGGMNMQAMMKQAQKMQEQLVKAQEELENTEVVGTSGGDLVTVVINGKKNLLRVNIKPEAVDPDDIEMLEDLLIAAFNEATEQVDEMSKENNPMNGMGGLF